ncbi:MAG: cobalamin-dependent protein [Elusimicrobia bacterium]|nr:cobalamin-dependent protein [Elusimicrobiota bacterium]
MLLINPMVDPTSQPSIVKDFTYASFPNALAYLACYLKEKNNDKIKILDEQLTPLTEEIIREEIEKIDGPKIVGITCLTVTFKRVLELTRQIKRIAPEALIVIGGIHATALPDECLIKTSADIVVRGEGEQTLSELYRVVQEKGSFKGIKGISFKQNGEIIHNPPRGLIENLEEIPPFPYDLFENNIERYKDFGTIFSSRGCPFDCIFCSQRLISGKRYRFLPAHRVIAKIKLLVDKYHQTKIWFMDDNFVINKKRIFTLLNEIIDSGYHKKVCFIAQTRGKDLNREVVMKMKEANFVSIAFGVETASERLMSFLDKGEKVEDNIKAIEMVHESGILTDASFIFGLPTETREDRRLTSMLARSLPLDGARFNIAVPYPGTKFCETAKLEGRLNALEDWSNCSNQHYMQSDNIPYSPVGTSQIELIYDTLMANLSFSLRPKILIKIFFTSALSGGGVISLPKRWYFSPKVVVALVKFAIVIMKRCMAVIFRGIVYKFFKTENKNTEVVS